MKDGKVYVVGIGPGAKKQMTIQAMEAIDQSEVIVGYALYIELIQKDFPEKRYLATPMRQEVRRCRMAMEEAERGRTVAMICSGDAGVYGMAGLMLEVGKEYPDVKVEMIPGITAASGGAAVLGAPLMHDFAVISLSDLLTPWEKIERRLEGAAMADFVICLYNPGSKKRTGHLKRACDCMLKYKAKDTVCGIVQNIGRKGETYRILTLEELRETPVDMFSTVFVGNEQTKRMGNYMVTPRGYRNISDDKEE